MDADAEPPTKKRLLSAVVKDEPPPIPEPSPRVLPKNDDERLVRRNRRMFGALLVGTLEKFREEDKRLQGSEAFLRRSETLKRAEAKADEERERARQKFREEAAERRKRELTLKVKLAAKVEEKSLELLFLQWLAHHTRLRSFLRTTAEPHIYFQPAKPSAPSDELHASQQAILDDWKKERRMELSAAQKQLAEERMAALDAELARMASRSSGARRGPPQGTAAQNGGEGGDGSVLEEGGASAMELGGGEGREEEAPDEEEEEEPEVEVEEPGAGGDEEDEDAAVSQVAAAVDGVAEAEAVAPADADESGMADAPQATAAAAAEGDDDLVGVEAGAGGQSESNVAVNGNSNQDIGAGDATGDYGDAGGGVATSMKAENAAAGVALTLMTTASKLTASVAAGETPRRRERWPSSALAGRLHLKLPSLIAIPCQLDSHSSLALQGTLVKVS
eukprot:SM000035S13041  [mRNA]  locus=s35:77659:80722:+ [translate_table: standard]